MRLEHFNSRHSGSHFDVCLQVWVPEDEPGSSSLPPAMSESDFAQLTAVAAQKVAVEEAAAAPYQPPAW